MKEEERKELELIREKRSRYVQNKWNDTSEALPPEGTFGVLKYFFSSENKPHTMTALMGERYFHDKKGIIIGFGCSLERSLFKEKRNETLRNSTALS